MALVPNVSLHDLQTTTALSPDNCIHSAGDSTARHVSSLVRGYSNGILLCFRAMDQYILLVSHTPWGPKTERALMCSSNEVLQGTYLLVGNSRLAIVQ